MLKISEIPIDFIIENTTSHQKGSIENKYYIKNELAKWDGMKNEIYGRLADELNLSFSRIRKIANGLGRLRRERGQVA